MKYVVLGGAGAMGRITVRDLVETGKSGDNVIIADFDLAKAEALRDSLLRIRKNKSTLIDIQQVDLRNPSSMDAALRGAFVVINSAPYQFNLDVMRAALRNGVHYVDLGGLFHKTLEQLKLHEEFKKKNLVAVLGMGAAPGITNLLAQMGCNKLDKVSEIHCRVGSMDKTRYEPEPALSVSYTLATILEEFSFQPAVFKNGKMTFVKPMTGDKPHRFPNPVGVRKPMYTIHSEVATLPFSYKEKGVREVSFKIAFDTEFTQKVRFLRDIGFGSHEPISIGPTLVKPIDVVNKIAMNQPASKQKGPLKQYEVVRTIVKGQRGSKKQTLILDCHTRGMKEWGIGLDIDTGSPPAVVAQMIADGKVREMGALPPEKCIPASEFFKRLRLRGMHVKVSSKAGWSFQV